MNIIYIDVNRFHVSFLFSTALVVSLYYGSGLYMILDFTQYPKTPTHLHSHMTQHPQWRKRKSAPKFSNGKTLLKKSYTPYSPRGNYKTAWLHPLKALHHRRVSDPRLSTADDPSHKKDKIDMMISFFSFSFFFFFSENRVWQFMQIVSMGDNLHVMSNPVF